MVSNRRASARGALSLCSKAVDGCESEISDEQIAAKKIRAVKTTEVFFMSSSLALFLRIFRFHLNARKNFQRLFQSVQGLRHTLLAPVKWGDYASVASYQKARIFHWIFSAALLATATPLHASVRISSSVLTAMKSDYSREVDLTDPPQSLSAQVTRVKIYPIVKVPSHDHFPPAATTKEVSFSNRQGLRVRDFSTGNDIIPTGATDIRLAYSNSSIQILFQSSGGSEGEESVSSDRRLWVAPVQRSEPTAVQWKSPGPLRGAIVNKITQFAGSFAVAVYQEGPRGNQATTAPALNVINHVNTETYVSAVVGAEMLRTFSQNAKGFQALAARTNAVVAMVQSRARTGSEWDILPTTMNQQYLGTAKETDFTRESVRSTKGEYIAMGINPIYAMYHSNSGGMTCASEECQLRGTPFDYLKPVLDADDAHLKRYGGHNIVRLTAAQVSGVVENLPSFSRAGLGTDFEVLAIRESAANVSTSNRVWVYDMVVSTGSGGTRTVSLSKDDSRTLGNRLGFGFRLLQSPAEYGQPLQITFNNGSVELPVYGFGHAVGASQWGAHLLGLPKSQGGKYEWSAEKIATHFYPGTEIVTLAR